MLYDGSRSLWLKVINIVKYNYPKNRSLLVLAHSYNEKKIAELYNDSLSIIFPQSLIMLRFKVRCRISDRINFYKSRPIFKMAPQIQPLIEWIIKGNSGYYPIHDQLQISLTKNLNELAIQYHSNFVCVIIFSQKAFMDWQYNTTQISYPW